MNQLLKRYTSLRNLNKTKSTSGQVMTLMILLLVLAVGFVLATVNIGSIAVDSTNMANATDAAALSLASSLATKANNLWVSFGKHTEKCETKSFWAVIGAIIAAVLIVFVCGAPCLAFVATQITALTGIAAAATSLGTFAVAGAVAGAIGGTIGAAAEGSNILQGAVIGFAVGAAIGTAGAGIEGAAIGNPTTLTGAGTVGEGGATVSGGVGAGSMGIGADGTLTAGAVDVGGGMSLMPGTAVAGSAFAPVTVTAGSVVPVSSTACMIPLAAAATAGAGSIALGTLGVASSVYNVSQQYVGEAKYFTDMMNKLKEGQGFRERAFFTVLSQMADNPNKVVDVDDINGNGNTQESVASFAAWWFNRMKQYQNINGDYDKAFQNIDTPLDELQKWAESLDDCGDGDGYLAKADYAWSIDSTGQEIAVKGCRDRHGNLVDGKVYLIFRALYDAGYDTTKYFSPGPGLTNSETDDPAGLGALTAWHNQECCRDDVFSSLPASQSGAEVPEGETAVPPDPSESEKTTCAEQGLPACTPAPPGYDGYDASTSKYGLDALSDYLKALAASISSIINSVGNAGYDVWINDFINVDNPDSGNTVYVKLGIISGALTNIKEYLNHPSDAAHPDGVPACMKGVKVTDPVTGAVTCDPTACLPTGNHCTGVSANCYVQLPCMQNIARTTDPGPVINLGHGTTTYPYHSDDDDFARAITGLSKTITKISKLRDGSDPENPGNADPGSSLIGFANKIREYRAREDSLFDKYNGDFSPTFLNSVMKDSKGNDLDEIPVLKGGKNPIVYAWRDSRGLQAIRVKVRFNMPQFTTDSGWTETCTRLENYRDRKGANTWVAVTRYKVKPDTGFVGDWRPERPFTKISRAYYNINPSRAGLVGIKQYKESEHDYYAKGTNTFIADQE